MAQYMSQQNVVEIIRQHPDPLEACHAVVQEAYDLWLQVRACVRASEWVGV